MTPKTPEPNEPETIDVVNAILFIVDLLLLMALMSGCAPHRVAPITTGVGRPTYAYTQNPNDTFVVYLPLPTSEKDAKAEICPKGYVCLVKDAGRVVIIERKRD